MTGKLPKILKAIEAQKVDCFLLNHEPNVSYAAGFATTDSYLIASEKSFDIITDFRYTADYASKAPKFVKIIESKSSVFKTICKTLISKGYKRVGFESRHLTFAECQKLHDLSKNKIQWIPLEETIEVIRQIKTTEELEYIKKAIQITNKTYDIIQNKLKPGTSELELAAIAEHFIRICGASSAAFNIIIASGPNSSYPHASISNRIIKSGEPVLIDLGVTYNGYKSDLTRTFFLGKINPIVEKVNNIVKEAHKRAIKAIKPEISIKSVDGAARNYIRSKGFGKNFGHSLGHGVGLEVHEAPSINKNNNQKLKKGMVFTVEPGIYLAGSFGVRHEDMVLVTDDGVEVLSGNHRY